MICDMCGKEGASEVIDPFMDEVYDEIVLRIMCDDCYEERRLDV